MEDMNPLALLLGGALAPGAYRKLKTTNTPALLKKFNVKVNNPLYHNTDVVSTSNILKTGEITPSSLGPPISSNISLTRNPLMDEISGRGKTNVQIILDKKDISLARGAKVKPYVYSPELTGTGKTKQIEAGSPIFGKHSPWFESEERIVGKGMEGLSTKNIKAIKVREAGDASDLTSLIKRAADKKIPVIVEPAAEKGVMGLLDIMNPKQQSKVLKNTKFAGGKVRKDVRFKKSSDFDISGDYEGIVDGKKYRVYKEGGKWYSSETNGYIGDTVEEATDYIKKGYLDQEIEFDKM